MKPDAATLLPSALGWVREFYDPKWTAVEGAVNEVDSVMSDSSFHSAENDVSGGPPSHELHGDSDAAHASTSAMPHGEERAAAGTSSESGDEFASAGDSNSDSDSQESEGHQRMMTIRGRHKCACCVVYPALIFPVAYNLTLHVAKYPLVNVQGRFDAFLSYCFLCLSSLESCPKCALLWLSKAVKHDVSLQAEAAAAPATTRQPGVRGDGRPREPDAVLGRSAPPSKHRHLVCEVHRQAS